MSKTIRTNNNKNEADTNDRDIQNYNFSIFNLIIILVLLCFCILNKIIQKILGTNEEISKYCIRDQVTILFVLNLILILYTSSDKNKSKSMDFYTFYLNIISFEGSFSIFTSIVIIKLSELVNSEYLLIFAFFVKRLAENYYMKFSLEIRLAVICKTKIFGFVLNFAIIFFNSSFKSVNITRKTTTIRNTNGFNTRT